MTEGFPRDISGTGNAPLSVHHGTLGCPETAPRILGAESGMSCLRIEETDRWWSPLAADVLALADAMRSAPDGMWLAFVAVPGERPLALVQSNRDPAEDVPGFYGSHHDGPTDWRVWNDFYSRAGYYLLDGIERRWSAPAIN